MTFLNRHRSRIRPVGPFAPSSLFFGGIPGAWYDPTDLSTMFQDSAGTTPVTAVEQPVGLILDKSQGLALGAELVANGTFNTGITGWNNFQPARGTVSWNAAAQRLRVDNTTGTGDAYVWTNTAVTAGKTYKIEYNFYKIAGASGSAEAKLYWWNGVATVGTISQIATISNNLASFLLTAPAGATSILVGSDVTQIWEIDNVSVRELAGNHASQSTAASRPTYRARYNLLTYSEDYANAAWTKGGLNTTGTPPWIDVTTAPDGTTTADRFIETAVSAQHFAYNTATVVAGTYTMSVYVKGTGGAQRFVCLYPQAGGLAAYAVFNVDTGAVTFTGGAQFVSASSSSVGNGWIRCVLNFTSPAAAMLAVMYLQSSGAVPAQTYLGDGSSGAYIWGAQLLTAADVTATGNAYQRIAAATVYDTAPVFRPYLAFDGLDDSLSTAAINFTSTDKMTVFAGVTKLTNATAGIITELSPTVNSSAGSFAALADAGPAYAWAVYGTQRALYNGASYSAPTTNVNTVSFNIAGATIATEIFPRVNTLIPSLTPVGTDAGTGNFGTWPLYIGARAGTSVLLNGRLFSLIVRGAASSVTEIADTELWVNARTGAF